LLVLSIFDNFLLNGTKEYILEVTMMTKENSYLIAPFDNAVTAIVEGIDLDVERGEDALMLGLGLVMLSSIFAPIAPPTVLLPIVAFIFACSAGYARINYHRMEQKLSASIAVLDHNDIAKLKAIVTVFRLYPMPSLIDSLNPCKNLKRTWKSALGGIIINPFWMPIFYMMGMQIKEEANLGLLIQAIIEVEQKLAPALIKD
jgi:hypothetical protein